MSHLWDFSVLTVWLYRTFFDVECYCGEDFRGPRGSTSESQNLWRVRRVRMRNMVSKLRIISMHALRYSASQKRGEIEAQTPSCQPQSRDHQAKPHEERWRFKRRSSRQRSCKCRKWWWSGRWRWWKWVFKETLYRYRLLFYWQKSFN